MSNIETFVSYGLTKETFNRDKIYDCMMNKPHFNKPNNACCLWASTIGKYSWKEFCDEEGYPIALSKKLTIEVDMTDILIIDNFDFYDKLPKIDTVGYHEGEFQSLNYRFIKQFGFDNKIYKGIYIDYGKLMEEDFDKFFFNLIGSFDCNTLMLWDLSAIKEYY